MKNSELFFRLFLFNLIIIVSTAAAVFTSDFNGSLKIVVIIMFILLIVLLGFLDVLLYIKNKIDKFNDKDGIYR